MRVCRLPVALCLLGAILFVAAPLHAQKKPPAGCDLTQVRQEKLGPGKTFQDAAGQIWRTMGHSLLRWDGKAARWAETPVKGLPHPPWDPRPASPWGAWAQPPRVLTGAGGTVLAVAVRDVYQDVLKDHPDKAKDWREVLQLGKALAVGRDQPFWLVGWIYHDGRWTGPQSLAELLAAERRVLLRDFQGQTPTAGFFDLQSDGKNLWYSDGRSVHVFDGRGKLASWALPEGKSSPPLRPTNLVRLPDGTLWCLHGAEVTALTLADGRIVARAEPGARLPDRAVVSDISIHVARDGQVFFWSERWLGNRPFFWRKGAWVREEEMGPFAGEDADGGLWFLPGGGEGTWSEKGYNLLRKGERYRVPLPERCQRGAVTPAGAGRLLAAGSDRCFVLVRAEKEPAGWRVEATYGLKSFGETGGLFLDRHGHVVGESGWSARWPAAPG
jgi:hypothetical protein